MDKLVEGRDMAEPAERLLSPSEVAKVFRVDPKTVSRWASAGRLNGVKTPGGHWRFSAAEIRAAIGQRDSA